MQTPTPAGSSATTSRRRGSAVGRSRCSRSRRRRGTQIACGRRSSQASGSALADLPGIARADEGCEVALAALLDRCVDLLCHQLVVARSLDVAEHAQRQLAVLGERHPRDRERLRRVEDVLVVDEAEAVEFLLVLEVEAVLLLV